MEAEKTVDAGLIEEEKKFVKALELMTTLRRKEIIALTKIYGLGGFFEKYASRIIQKQLGERVAEIVLSILRLRKCRAEYMEGINKSANDNPRLTTALRNWILNEEPKTIVTDSKAYAPPKPPERIEQEKATLFEMMVEDAREMADATRGGAIDGDV